MIRTIARYGARHVPGAVSAALKALLHASLTDEDLDRIINVIQTTFPGSGQLVTTSERTTGR